MAYKTKSAKELKRFYPIEEGLTAETQKQTGRIMNLMPVEGSTVSKKEKVGLK